MAQLLNTVYLKGFGLKGWARTRGGICIAALLVGLCSAFAAVSATAADAPEALGALSDAQLTNLAADWQQLDASARADLIAETRERMQPSIQASTQASAQTASQSTSQLRVQSGSQPSVPQAPEPHAHVGQPAPSVSESERLTLADASHGQQAQAPGQITLRAQRRRYGRIVRKADGSLVRIETQVVTVQRRDPKRAFGVGFERRQRQHGQPPVTTASSAQESSGLPVSSRPPEPVPPAAQGRTPGIIAVTKTLN